MTDHLAERTFAGCYAFVKAVAETHDLCPDDLWAQVRRRCRRQPGRPGNAHRYRLRNERVVAAVRAGRTYAEVAAAEGLTADHVSKIVCREYRRERGRNAT